MLSNRDSLKKTKITLFCLGLLILIIFILSLIHAIYIINEAVKIESVIIAIKDSKTIVRFILNGKQLTHQFNYTNDFKTVGDTLYIYYLMNSDKYYLLFELIFPSIILLSVGLPFFIVGLTYYLNEGRIKKFNQEKDKMIRKVAKVRQIEKNRLYSVNNKYPYRLICEVYYEGEKLILKSKNFWNYIPYEKHFVIDVYFKTKKKYFIDLESYRKDELYYEMEDF